ncbi:tigger transposable element-derived protein 4-like [Mercenaria mercenaria]|uniref:tigger transposable element-derived protein 4-like n=1 Tax=Mercenaria mercenaria TaxID=6596 RepID=UPI00234F2D20|nr:tigger transposable element-derived protein 4-like [Mercenaria mercenaria]
MQKADQFAESLGIQDFQAKAGWLSRFKDRHNISFRSVCGEAKSVDTNTDAMKQWEGSLSALLEKYDPECIYNADETGIFYKMLPDKTLEFKNVDCSGGKRSKERLTVLVCANMTGTDKLPLFVIGKSAKPRCFKNKQTLPTKYSSNAKAWMTSEIFIAWLKDLDAALNKRRRNIALVVDNCPAHPNFKKLEHIELVFLPPNTTSKTQPMDQGVIQNLKVHYRKRVVISQVAAIENKEEFTINVLDALRFLQQSWECVTSTTISNCYRHAGFSTERLETPQEAETLDDEDELDDIPLAKLVTMGYRDTLSDFIQFSEDLPTSEALTDDAIVSSVIESRQEVDADADEDDDDVSNTPTRTVDDAMQALDVLRDFFVGQPNSEEELSTLCRYSRKLLRCKMDSLGKQKQKSILQFATKFEDRR